MSSSRRADDKAVVAIGPPLMIDLSAIGFAGHGLAFKIALDEARISVG